MRISTAKFNTHCRLVDTASMNFIRFIRLQCKLVSNRIKIFVTRFLRPKFLEWSIARVSVLLDVLPVQLLASVFLSKTHLVRRFNVSSVQSRKKLSTTTHPFESRLFSRNSASVPHRVPDQRLLLAIFVVLASVVPENRIVLDKFHKSVVCGMA